MNLCLCFASQCQFEEPKLTANVAQNGMSFMHQDGLFLRNTGLIFLSSPN